MKTPGVSQEPASERAMQEPCSHKETDANRNPEIGAPSTMDVEGRIITLEFDGFVTKFIRPLVMAPKRFDDRQVWDAALNFLGTLDKQKPARSNWWP